MGDPVQVHLVRYLREGVPARGARTRRGSRTRGPDHLHLTVGEAADCQAYDALIDLPERAPDALFADKDYDADAIRALPNGKSRPSFLPGQTAA